MNTTEHDVVSTRSPPWETSQRHTLFWTGSSCYPNPNPNPNPNSRYTLFLDWKLVLRSHPQAVLEYTLGPHSVYGPAGWVAFRHPCTTTYSTMAMCRINPKQRWLFTEAEILLSQKARTSDTTLLKAQLRRYASAPRPIRGLKFRTYQQSPNDKF